MIKATTCKTKACADVFHLQIRQFVTNLLRRKPVGEKIQHVTDADSHSANARTPATLLRVYRDSFINVRHRRTP